MGAKLDRNPGDYDRWRNVEKAFEEKWDWPNDPAFVAASEAGRRDGIAARKARMIPIKHENAPIVVDPETGAMQSSLEARFDLLPPAAMALVSKVLDHGARKYGEWNWLGLKVSAHVNHSLSHSFSYLAGDQQDCILLEYSPELNHLAKAATRALMALEARFQLEMAGEAGEEVDVKEDM